MVEMLIALTISSLPAHGLPGGARTVLFKFYETTSESASTHVVSRLGDAPRDGDDPAG
jgi:hypothetical protein